MKHAAIEAAFAEAVADAGRAVPPGLGHGRGTAAAASRFAVYRNNVAIGLCAALAERFPVTQRLVGGDFFAGMARSFVARRKPDSPLMFAYGDDFPDFITGFAPAAAVPYLADVARLEMLRTRAYHAADAAPLTIDMLAQVAQDRLPLAVLAAHPAAALLASPHPAGSIWAAHQDGALNPPRIWEAETVLVTRPDMEVGVHILPDRDKAFAAALLAGEPLGRAAEAAMTASRHFDFGAALIGLVALGAFAANITIAEGSAYP